MNGGRRIFVKPGRCGGHRGSGPVSASQGIAESLHVCLGCAGVGSLTCEPCGHAWGDRQHFLSSGIWSAMNRTSNGEAG